MLIPRDVPGRETGHHQILSEVPEAHEQIKASEEMKTLRRGYDVDGSFASRSWVLGPLII